MNARTICDITPRESLVSMAEMTRILTLSRSSVYRLLKSGELDQPIRVSANRIAWTRDQVAAFLAKRGGCRHADSRT